MLMFLLKQKLKVHLKSFSLEMQINLLINISKKIQEIKYYWI